MWAGALAFTLWGFFPLYFRLQPGIFPPEVLANRIVWALLLVAIVLTWQSRWSWLGPALRSRRVMASFVASALLLSANWMTYIWAVSNGHVVEASLGYFITPLSTSASATACSASGRGAPSGSRSASPPRASSG